MPDEGRKPKGKSTDPTDLGGCLPGGEAINDNHLYRDDALIMTKFVTQLTKFVMYALLHTLGVTYKSPMMFIISFKT